MILILLVFTDECKLSYKFKVRYVIYFLVTCTTPFQNKKELVKNNPAIYDITYKALFVVQIVML